MEQLLAARTRDVEAIERIIAPMIPEVMGDGYLPKDAGDLIDVEDYWLDIGGIAMFMLETEGNNCLRGHAFVPSDKRYLLLPIFQAVARWYVDETDIKYFKLNVQVPVTHKRIRRFLLAVGFQFEGFNRASLLRGGRIIDAWCFGITKPEVNERIQKWFLWAEKNRNQEALAAPQVRISQMR